MICRNQHFRTVSCPLTGRKTAASQGDQIDIEEYAEVVTSYIAKCTEDVTVIKTFTACGNRKP